MFKRVERKRKRREKEEELDLDDNIKKMIGLNDTDSDESDSGSEQDRDSVQSDSDTGINEDGNQDEVTMSEDERVNEVPPISVEEALKDPIYLISLDPTVHGCVVCKGKLIKNAGMATAHRNAKGHKRRFETFRQLSTDADQRNNAWELIRVIQSASGVQKVESQELSKRALKRQAKRAAICKKREHHKELRAKAIAKKALRKLSVAEETRPIASSKANLHYAPGSHWSQPGITRKKQRLETKTSITKTQDVAAKLVSRTKASSDNKKPVFKSRTKRHNKNQQTMIA